MYVFIIRLNMYIKLFSPVAVEVSKWLRLKVVFGALNICALMNSSG